METMESNFMSYYVNQQWRGDELERMESHIFKTRANLLLTLLTDLWYTENQKIEINTTCIDRNGKQYTIWSVLSNSSN